VQATRKGLIRPTSSAEVIRIAPDSPPECHWETLQSRLTVAKRQRTGLSAPTSVVRYSSAMHPLDRLIVSVDNALRTVSGAVHAARPNPAAGLLEAAAMAAPGLRRESGALMRVNHVGEVCAQALYQAQALSARSPALRQQMQAAAREETDHLAWTQHRLNELGARPSLLNPLWYGGSFLIGLLAGRMGDSASLGFVVETERQVEQHLASHLDRLPAEDARSRAIVAGMQEDERRHAEAAVLAGASALPAPLRWAMRLAAKAMTATAYRV
jgi:3-demethoxyubiquinol 3-hydroxylase